MTHPDLDLFSAAGGASTGLSILGRTVLGIDYDAAACATHAAAGHPTIRADLTQPLPLATTARPEFVWASPPCTAFSYAGRGAGRRMATDLIECIDRREWDGNLWLATLDPSVWLVLPTMRALLDLAPAALAMENVPPTLPVMEACARVLRRAGYKVATGVLSAECYGVAQTRKRAFLIARRGRAKVALPAPTHAPYVHPRHTRKAEEAHRQAQAHGWLPWVSMADALGWPEHASTGHETARGAGMVERHGPRSLRRASSPSEVLTGRSRSWSVVGMDRRQASDGVAKPVVPAGDPSPTLAAAGLAKGVAVWRLRTNGMANDTTRDVDHPAPTVAFGRNASAWGWERPATTLVSSFRPDVVAGPGYRRAGDGPRQDAPGSVAITIAEAARLQAFPNGHPWQGSRSSIFAQIGNAVPPPVAAAVAGAALGVDWTEPVADYLHDLYAEPLR